MALVFPRVMPQGVNAVGFELQRFDYMSPESGGAIGSVTGGLPRWAGRWTLAEREPRSTGEWRAWVASLRGSQRTFIGRDYSRPRPAFYAGGLPSGWNGDLTGWSQTITADGQAIFSVTGLYGGMGVGAGDQTDLRWTGGDGEEHRFLVRCVQDNPSSGGAASFPIEPPIPSWVPSNATAHMNEPGCVMRLVTGETTISDVSLIGSIAGTVISGLQDLRP